jgi:flagellar motor switch protein FliG
MKGLDEARQQILYANMSERAATQLRDDLESMGPTRLRDVEAAQQRWVAVARALRESGEIQLPIGGGVEDEADESYV